MNVFFELLGNPVVLFIIIGVLSSLFRSGQQQQKKQPPGTNQSGRTESQGQMSRSEETPKQESIFDQWRRELEEKVQETIPEIQRHRQSQPEPTVQTLANQKESKKTETNVYQSYQDRKRDLDAEMSKLQAQFSQNQQKVSAIKGIPKLDRSKVVEGIIWSEVLGAPRAKKPYRPNGYRD